MAMQSSGRDKVIRTHLTDMIGKVTGGHCEPLGVELPQMYTHINTHTLTDLKISLICCLSPSQMERISA